MKDIPENSHLKASMIISVATVQGVDSSLDLQWDNYGGRAIKAALVNPVKSLRSE